MTICVSYTYGENYGELANITIPPLVKYCSKHGYHCDINKVPPNEKGNYSFIRVKHALDLLKRFDVVLILEGDMSITNLNYKVEDFIDDYHSIFCAADVNGMNSASFIVVRTEWAKTFLEWVYSQRDDFGDEQNIFERNAWKEIKTLPHPSINSIPYEKYAPSYGYINWEQFDPPPTLPTREMGKWDSTCFICHCPGMPLSKRLEIFKEIQHKIQYD